MCAHHRPGTGGAHGELPPGMREGLAAWSTCFAGALEVDELQALLIAAGFEDAGVEITRTFGPADLDLLPATLLAELGVENLPATSSPPPRAGA